MYTPSRWFAAIIFLSFVASAFAQGRNSNRVIAVNVDSSDPRIQQLLPGLRDEASEVVEKSARNVRAIIVMGSSSMHPEEEARQNSADYLLTINLSIRPSVDIPLHGGPENGPTTTADVPKIGGVPYGITHSRCADLLGAFTFSYTVISLTGKNLKLHDSHTMRKDEYPLGPELYCLDKLSTHAVRNYAATAVQKLKSKNGL